jgi:hypothetical protein
LVGILGRDHIDRHNQKDQERNGEKGKGQADRGCHILVPEDASKRDMTAAMDRRWSRRSHACRWRALEVSVDPIVDLKTRTGCDMDARVEYTPITDGALMKRMLLVEVVWLTRWMLLVY